MSDLTVDGERKKWLRALRSTNDALVLELLDEHNRRLQAETWLKALAWAQQEVYGRFADDVDELSTTVSLRQVIGELQRLATEANPYGEASA